MRREKTGYFDRIGKTIRDGDKVRAILDGQIYTGYVDEFNGEWRLLPDRWALTPLYQSWQFNLSDLDDVEILERGD